MLGTRKRAASLGSEHEQKPRPWGQGKSRAARKRARHRAEKIPLQAAQQGQILQLAGEEPVRKENAVPIPAAKKDSNRGPGAVVTLDFSTPAGFQSFGTASTTYNTAVAPVWERNALGLDHGSGPTQAKWESTVRGRGMPSFGQLGGQSTTSNHSPETSGPFRERSIQDIYQENPEKRLRSIEPSTLYLVAQTIQQIADEAANDWHQTALPGINWSDKITADVSGGASSTGTVDIDALKRRDNLIAPLLRASKAMVSKSTTMSMLALCRIMDQCISVCRLVNDDRRHVLLQKAKEKIEWLPVCLDCKRLDVQRQAIMDLDGLHESIREKHVFTNNPEILRSACVDAEIRILDRSLVEFQEHRLRLLIDMFRTLKQLLGATG